ncbi:hypothetical protein ACFSNA_13775 [Pedobacter mendelii]|uniref:hypothetical protein n=1 Tax=Pedobacter mendelii TaxID=1908240 RepID=UPI0036198218
MRKLVILDICFCLINIMLYCSCKGYETKNLNNRDSVLIVNEALNHILRQNILPKEYYNQALQLIKPKGFKQDVKIMINGKECIILAEDTNVKDVLNNMNIYNPPPLVEIPLLELRRGLIYMEIIFRATGHSFLLKIKKDKIGRFNIVEINEKTI